jgi:hypothetical protein
LKWGTSMHGMTTLLNVHIYPPVLSAACAMGKAGTRPDFAGEFLRDGRCLTSTGGSVAVIVTESGAGASPGMNVAWKGNGHKDNASERNKT